MVNRPTLKLPVKIKAHAAQESPAAALPAEPALEAPANRGVRYPLIRSLWPASHPATPVVASVRHRSPAPGDA